MTHQEQPPLEQSRFFSLEQVGKIVTEILLPSWKAGTLFVFHGVLGAGKTTLIKQLCAHVGIKDEVISPTYMYMNTYIDGQNRKVYHFDLYRLDKIEDFFDMGFDAYLADKEAISIIEWPGVIMPLLADFSCRHRVVTVSLLHTDQTNEQREIRYQLEQ